MHKWGIFRTVRDGSDFIERSTHLDSILHICNSQSPLPVWFAANSARWMCGGVILSAILILVVAVIFSGVLPLQPGIVDFT